MQSEKWWLKEDYWQADMNKVLDNHMSFIERQRNQFNSNFMGLPIEVRDGVYHPFHGSSTHVVADAVLRIVRRDMEILEIGSGSGALACFLASQGCQVVATDIDVHALECAQLNINNSGLQDRVTLIHSNLFESVPDKQFDMIIFNPPLLHCEAIAVNEGLEQRYDDIAIDVNGEALIQYGKQAKRYLKPSGQVITLVSNIGKFEVIEEFTKEMNEVDVLYAQYRNSGNQWRFVLAATNN